MWTVNQVCWLRTGPDKEGAGPEGLGRNEELKLLSRTKIRVGLQL